MKQIWIVTKETYLRHVKSWSFVVMVLAPFLMLGLSIGLGYIQGATAGRQADKIALVSSEASLLDGFAMEENFTQTYKDEAAAKKAIKEEKILGYVAIESENGQIKAVYHGEGDMKQEDKLALLQTLQQLQTTINVSQAKLSSEQQAALNREPQFSEKINEAKEQKKSLQKIGFFIISMLIYMILLTYSASTAQDIANEKGTKIMEVIFSSIKASQYFYGRLLGILGVIVTHFSIYILGGFALVALGSNIDLIRKFLDENPETISQLGTIFSPATIAFAVLGVCAYVILSAFCGSLVVRIEDAQKATQPIIFLVMLGLFGSMSLGQTDTVILKVGSYLPFLSTFFMPQRLINGYASNIEALISFAVLLAFTLAMAWYIGRIYAGLILQTDDIGFIKSFKKALTHK
ncbi:ABC transporter permease [Streptococcus panodentis]|uniref:ABC transporter permease n=1 Tax=Streptococcus panodentis TaxID=1581472 RepID=A0ABS5AZ37_9STRE|nr:ABC transporter permease [Streptococcus panodentis]MBP2621854.1 ABC transporter permease [Streptococcus panodentis]